MQEASIQGSVCPALSGVTLKYGSVNKPEKTRKEGNFRNSWVLALFKSAVRRFRLHGLKFQ